MQNIVQLKKNLNCYHVLIQNLSGGKGGGSDVISVFARGYEAYFRSSYYVDIQLWFVQVQTLLRPPPLNLRMVLKMIYYVFASTLIYLKNFTSFNKYMIHRYIISNCHKVILTRFLNFVKFWKIMKNYFWAHFLN